MGKFFFGFILGIAVAGAVVWYYSGGRDQANVRDFRNQVTSTAKEAGEMTRDKLHEWGLTSDNIKDELARTGQVIRQKSQDAGVAIADATADARITTTIKAKLVKEPD